MYTYIQLLGFYYTSRPNGIRDGNVMSGQMDRECKCMENFFCKGAHHHQAHDLRFLNFLEFCMFCVDDDDYKVGRNESLVVYVHVFLFEAEI